MEMVVRAVSNSLLSALLVATLLWGGCVSCPKFFMFPSAKKDCCKAGQCERSKPSKTTTSKECNRMPLEQPDSAHRQAALPVAIGTLSDFAPILPARTEAPGFFFALEHSPPDLNLLHSTFLI